MQRWVLNLLCLMWMVGCVSEPTLLDRWQPSGDSSKWDSSAVCGRKIINAGRRVAVVEEEQGEGVFLYNLYAHATNPLLFQNEIEPSPGTESDENWSRYLRAGWRGDEEQRVSFRRLQPEVLEISLWVDGARLDWVELDVREDEHGVLWIKEVNCLPWIVGMWERSHLSFRATDEGLIVTCHGEMMLSVLLIPVIVAQEYCAGYLYPWEVDRE